MMKETMKKLFPFPVCGMFALVLAAIVVAPIASWAGESGRDVQAGGKENKEHEDAEVHIDPEALRRFGVRVTAAGPGTLLEEIEVMGEVVADPDRVQHVRPRYPGVVRKVLRHQGDRVRAGEVLARIENSETLTSYPVRAGIDGVIVAEHASIGEIVEADHEMFEIVDTSRVWVDLQIFLDDLDQIRVGQRVRLIHSRHGPLAAGRIRYVSPVLDHNTRTGIARLYLRNDNGLWRPGLFVGARVAVAEVPVPVAVPRSAVLRDGDEEIVLVQDEDGAFARREVRVGRRGMSIVEIVDGLRAGERVVHEGGFLVKSELGKGAMGAGHSH